MRALRLVREDGPRPAPAPRTPEEAYRAYARYVGGVAYRLLGRDDEVDDVVQEVFVQLMRGWNSVQEPAALKRWLATVTTRVVSRKLSRRRVQRFFGLGASQPADYEHVADGGASSEDRALLAQVYRELDRLPAAERVAWTLRHVEGLRLEECALRCECSLATVKRRIRAAHSRLESRLSLEEAHDD
ncbi:MAG: sigma-70 family RNA polymerase sigma factor [Myxococcota bacterium]